LGGENMVKLIATRTIKKAPKKRATSHAERLKRMSEGDLILLLRTQPDMVHNSEGKKEKNILKIMAKKYLNLVHGLSDEDINEKIRIQKEKEEYNRDLFKYTKGLMSVDEITRKWNVKPDAVHMEAKRRFRFKVPTGMNWRKENVQQTLISNPTLYKMFYQKIREAVQHKDASIFTNWILNLVADRPEYSANVAFMLFGADDTKSDIKNEEKFSFKGKGGAAIRNKIEDLITEREIAKNKSNPFMPPKLDKSSNRLKGLYIKHYGEKTYDISEDGFFEKVRQSNTDDEISPQSQVEVPDVHKVQIDIKNSLPVPGSHYLVLDKKDPSKVVRSFTVPKTGVSLKNVGFTEKPKYRKKKIKPHVRRKKSRKVIKVKKPIKRCRCK
jgi:hypothetical protein